MSDAAKSKSLLLDIQDELRKAMDLLRAAGMASARVDDKRDSDALCELVEQIDVRLAYVASELDGFREAQP